MEELLPIALATIQDNAAAVNDPHTVLDGVCQALTNYSLSIPDAVPSAAMAEREFAWRNGFFLSHGMDKQPMHVGWLQKAGYGHLVRMADAL